MESLRNAVEGILDSSSMLQFSILVLILSIMNQNNLWNLASVITVLSYVKVTPIFFFFEDYVEYRMSKIFENS